MKGIVLAGGTGSRLFPITTGVNKHLLPIYDKPMIYYPIAKLLLLGIRDIAIICRQEDVNAYKAVLKRVIEIGVKISFLIQSEPNGIPEAFIIAENFISNDDVVLILGDNILYGNQLHVEIQTALNNKNGATVFGYRVSNPGDFGVVETDKSGNILSIEEKPKDPKSNFALIGLYKFDGNVAEFSRKLKPSDRGELEIVDLIKLYQNDSALHLKILGRGNTWLDTGNPENLLNAALFVQTIEKRQGYNIACLEEICLRKGYVDARTLRSVMPKECKTSYDNYILGILNEF